MPPTLWTVALITTLSPILGKSLENEMSADDMATSGGPALAAMGSASIATINAVPTAKGKCLRPITAGRNRRLG